MSQPATYSCPHCKNLFSINDPSMYGRQIACPTCQQPLVINAPQVPQSMPPAAPTQPSPFGNLPPTTQAPAGNFNATAGNFNAPAHQYQQPAPTQRKKKKKDLTWLYSLVAVLAVVGILVPAAWFTYSSLTSNRGSDGNVVDMTWLPEDTEVLVYADVDSLAASSLVQTQLKDDRTLQNALKEIAEITGLTINDVDSVTVGSGPNESEKIAVVRLKKALDVSRLKTEEESINGFSIYSNNRQKILLADETTVVVPSRSNEIQKVAERGAATKRFPQFDFADSNQDFFVCMVPTDREKFLGRNGAPLPPGMEFGEEVRKMQAAVPEMTALAFGGSLSGDSGDIKAQIVFPDSQLSGDFAGGIASLLSEAPKFLTQMPVPPNILSIINQVLGSTRASSSGSVAEVTTRLPLQEMIEAGGGNVPGFGPFGPGFGAPFN